MKAWFSKFILLIVTVNLVIPPNLVFAGPGDGDDDDFELSSAFSALSKSNNTSNSDAKVDAALDAAFDLLPAAVKNSDISLDEPKFESPKALDKAVNILANTDVEVPSFSSKPKKPADKPSKTRTAVSAPNKPADVPDRIKLEAVKPTKIESEYRQMGLSLSLTLWNGGQKTMKAVLTNIVKQLYSDQDPTSFRFVVNSSPLPYIKYATIDLNEELRNRLIAEEKRKELESESGILSGITKPKYKAQPVNVPERPGVQLTISAGLLASVKTVDELASQIAKKLAAEKKIYAWKDDPKWVRNQEYMEMINQIIEHSKNEQNKKDLTRLRDEVMAELYALERLAAGGFNPWALYNYERREMAWMGDVFMKSNSHSLARSILKANRTTPTGENEYRFDDGARSLRIVLQKTYMKFLQNNGRKMVNRETEFSPQMKWIRLRMKLFSEPFYFGLPWQLGGVALVGGFSIAGIFNAHLAHWALMAFNQTGGHVSALWHSTGGQLANYVGSLVHKVKMSQADKVVNTGYFGAHSEDVKSTASQFVGLFYEHYRLVLMTGVGVIAAGSLRFFRENIADFVEGAAKAMRQRQNEKLMKEPAPEVQVKNDDDAKSIFKDEMKYAVPARNDVETALNDQSSPDNFAPNYNSGPWFQNWLRQLGLFKESLFTFFSSLGGKAEVKKGKIYVRNSEAPDEGYALAITQADQPEEVRVFAPAPVEEIDEQGNLIEKVPRKPFADRFDEWLDGMNAKIKATGSAFKSAGGALGRGSIRIAVRVGTHSLNGLMRAADAYTDAVEIVFIDIPAHYYNLTLQTIAYEIAFINEKKEAYQVWRSEAPERARAREERRRAKEEAARQRAEDIARKKESARKEKERLANEAAEKAKAAAEKKRADAIAAAEQKKIDDAAAKVAAEQQKIEDAKQKRAAKDQAFWNKMDRLEAEAQKKRDQAKKKIDKQKADYQARVVEKSRQDRLNEGMKAREKFLANEKLRPAEIYEVWSKSETAQSVTYTSIQDWAEKWGVDAVYDGWQAKLRALSVQLSDKWLAQATKYGVTESEARNAVTLFSQMANTLNKKQKKQTFENGLALYELLLKVSTDESREKILRKDFQSWAGIAGQFLEDMETERQERISLARRSTEIKVNTIINASARTVEAKIAKLYLGNESEFIGWAAAPESKPGTIQSFYERIQKFVTSKGKLGRSGHRSRLADAIAGLSTISKAKIYLVASTYLERQSNYTNDAISRSRTRKALANSIDQLGKDWVSSVKNIRELVARVEADTAKYQIPADAFKNALRDQVMKRPDLFADRADVEVYVEKEYFWPTSNSTAKTTALEQPLVDLLKEKKTKFGDSPAWKYDPIWSERMHKILRDRLFALHQYPTTFEDLEATWKAWTSRGVSTITDEMLGELLKKGTADQIDKLEDYAVRQGRVFDQGLRDEFAIRQIEHSPEYGALMAVAKKPGTDRMPEIQNFVVIAQTYMQDLGARYGTFLEEVSKQIQTTQAEARYIHDARKKRIIGELQKNVDESNDARINMLKAVLPEIKRWSPKNQYNFLLYLRGSIDTDKFPFIEKQFPNFGPERIRKIYQGLPMEAAIFITNLYLQETIMRSDEVKEGYGKKLINFLVASAKEKSTGEKAAEFLDALFYGLEEEGSPAFQMDVLSALIVMRPDKEASIGETIKLILEQFPGVGPKIGQFTAATGLLGDDINEILKETQDNTLPPKRVDIYDDISDITGRKENPSVHIEKVPGSGSIKYTVVATDLTTGKKEVLQVFRSDVLKNVDMQINVLKYAIDKLVENDRTNAFLRVIVDGAMAAVEREKQFDKEAEKTKYAKTKLYSGFDDEDFSVSVPPQQLLNDRLLRAKFAQGVSFKKLSDADKLKVAYKLLDMEAKILYAQPNEKGEIWYDTDRHAGNYLIDVLNQGGRKKYSIAPIDFGQLTSINVKQRERVSELFAYATMLEKFGANEWLTKEVAKMFNITGVDYTEFSKNLESFFKGGGEEGKGKYVKAYFSLIAAINEAMRLNDKLVEKNKLKKSDLPARTGDIASGKLDIVYTDFVRAIIQLNQYEDEILKITKADELPKGTVTPRKILESKTKDILADRLQKIELSSKQERYIKYVLNTKAYVKAKLNGEEYEPVKYRLSREELENMSFFGDSKAGAKQAAPGVSTAHDAGNKTKPGIVLDVTKRFCRGAVEKVGRPFRKAKGA